MKFAFAAKAAIYQMTYLVRRGPISLCRRSRLFILLLVAYYGCGGRETSQSPERVDRKKLSPSFISDASHAKDKQEMSTSNPHTQCEDAELQYSLWIESDLGSSMEDAFNDDEHIVIGMSPVKANLVVYVNDSPVQIHCRGSSVFPIFDLLGPGKNQLRVEGKHPERLFLKVIIVDPKSFQSTFEVNKVLAKTWFKSTQESVRLDFQVDLPKGPDYEELQKALTPGDTINKEMRDLIAYWAACCRRHDADALFQSTLPDLKSPPSYLGNRDAAKRRASSFIDGINSGKFHLVTKVDDVKFIVGKRSVIAYAGVTEKSDPYLFEFHTDNGLDPFFSNAVMIVRLEGKWRVR